MAEEFVSKDQFNEFVKRMEQGFHHADQRFEQVNDRFGDIKAAMVGIRADMRQIRSWLVGLYSLVVFGFLGSNVSTIFKDSFFK